MIDSRRCLVMVPVLFLLIAGLLYTGRAFRIRDSPASTDVCHAVTGRCTRTFSSPISSTSSWSSPTPLRAKRSFDTVSSRGTFAKSEQQPVHEEDEETDHEPFVNKDKKSNDKLWSKKSKIEDVTEENVSTDEDQSVSNIDEVDDSEGVDSDDEIVLIEVEDEDEEDMADSIEGKISRESSSSEEEKRKIEEAENEKKKLELEEEKQKELQQQEKLKAEEIERAKEEIAERKRKENEERRRKKKELEERLKREQIERKLLKEAERKRLLEENKRKLKEENERKLKEEEENRLKEEKERQLKEEENRRIQEEEEQRLMEQQERQREEDERKQREIEEVEAERERKEEEEKRKEQEEAEAERKKRDEEEEAQREEEEAQRKRDEDLDRRRLENVKKETGLKKIRDKEESRNKPKQNDNDDSDNEDDDDTDNSEDDDDNDDENDNDSGINSETTEVNIEKAESDESEKSRSTESVGDKSKESKDQSTETMSKSEADVGKEAAEIADSKSSKESEKTDTQETIVNKPKVTMSSPSGEQRAHLTLDEMNDIILSVPTFVPNFTAVEDLACQQHGKIFLRQLRGYKLWAMQMLDSSAKIPSGLLKGNINQLGDFDQCLGVQANVRLDEQHAVRVQGKYCLASVDLYAAHPDMKLPVNLMQSRAMSRGTLRDTGHFVPRFTTANWALCLPAACSAADARRSIERALDIYNKTMGIKFAVGVDPKMCYVKERQQSYPMETIAVLYFYAFILALAIIATLRDYIVTTDEKATISYSERIIMAFSFKRTVKALLEYKEGNTSDIGCIHGIRSLSTICLYLAHKVILISLIPFHNRMALAEVAGNPLSSLLRASLFYTDCFLFMSGTLSAFQMSKELTKRGEIRWFYRYVARFFRLTPALLAVLLWYAFVMDHTGTGPQWNMLVKTNAELCKQNGWLNFFYLQNLLPFEEMCATHTHQLALDMQLTLVAPALVFFLQLKPILGVVIVFFLLQFSATLRYFATSKHGLSLVIFHGMSSKQLYKTANLTYTLPLHRATTYLVGVSLGALMHYTGKNVKIHKIFVAMGWMIAAACGAWPLLSPWRLARRDYQYDVEDAAHYAVVSPILSAIFASWTIFACFTGNGGIINKFLSSYWMVVVSRLSYAIYLTQFAVFFYIAGSTRYSTEFQIYKIIDPFEVASVIIAAIVLTLLFDTPMQELKNIIMEYSETLSSNFESTEEYLPDEDNWKSRNLSRDTTMDEEEEEEEEDEEEEDTGGWNWKRGTFTKVKRSEPEEYRENVLEEPYRSSRLKRLDKRRLTIVRSDSYDEWDNQRSIRRSSRSEEVLMGEGRGSRSDYRSSNGRLDKEVLMDEDYRHPRERYFSGGYTRSPMRDLDAPAIRRSASRERQMSQEREYSSRDYNSKPLITISKDEDYKRYPRAAYPRFSEQQRSLSSDTDIDVVSIRRNSNNFARHASAEPRLADDGEWEEELRNRRSRYLQHRVSSQERERVSPAANDENINGNGEEWPPLRRRSSAEGKIALLKEPLRPGNMELWTVSKLQLGSSQDPDEEDFEDEYLQQRREYREQGAPLREDYLDDEEEVEEENGEVEHLRNYASESLPTSFEDEDEANMDFVLSKDSKKITVQDLSNLPSDEEISLEGSWNRLDVKSGLFKRESIIKSQASEEDPEYLLPERPKLVEQEQEHPFKKAWQMQKSRSEEEGSSIYSVKDSKVANVEKQKEDSDAKNEKQDNHQGGQSEEILPSDVACEVTLVWQPRNNDAEDSRSCSKSESSSSIGFDYQEDQQLENRDRRKSEEDNWPWTERDT